MGLTMTTGVVVKWLKKEGDAVNKGEELLEIATEKITNTVEAPADGVLLKIVAPEETELPIGGLLGFIGQAGERIELAGVEQQSEKTAQAPEREVYRDSPGERSPGAGERVKITPAAAKLAKEIGFDYTRLAGTGPGGRITREDVEHAVARAQDFSADSPAEKPVGKETAGPGGAALYDLIPYSGMRKAIGDNMSRSWAAAARVTHHVAVNIAKLLEFRKMINEDLENEGKVSLTDLLIKITARALEIRPDINVSLDGSNIKIMKEINIGVAVALEKGLVVPVVKNANKQSLFQVSAQVRDLARKARENRLSLDEMSGGTFTVTNLGAYGSVDFFTPIINQPESAILGIGRTVETPVVIDGQVTVRPMMGLSLAFDHRVIDGAPAAEFLAVLIKLLEKPAKAVL